MDEILKHITFDLVGIIGLSVFALACLCQIFFYCFYYNKPVSYFNENKPKPLDSDKLPSVSVIIVAKNESENLAKNLPQILNQDYPNFEVIVVNDGSTDESEYILKRMKLDYEHIYHTFSPESEDMTPNRRKILSLTIGVKAAKNDILLFTEADSFPFTNQWIRQMMDALGNESDVVIGYNKYSDSKGTWGNIAKLDNLLFSLQYLSKAIYNMPFTAIHKNVAFKKKLFFDNKGFSAFLNYESSEQIFMNNLLIENKTAVALCEESFVDTQMSSFSLWKNTKANYYKAFKHFKGIRHKAFSLETISRLLLYGVAVWGISYTIYSMLWAYLIVFVLLYLTKRIVQTVILNNAAKHFKTKLPLALLPIYDILQPLYNAYFTNYSRAKNKRK